MRVLWLLPRPYPPHMKDEDESIVQNYLISLRMEKAGKILEENPMLSIQKVADEVGYDDAYHFSKLLFA